MPMINCPACSASLKIPEGMAGRKARCNKCQNIFVIPAAAPPMSPIQSAPPRPAGSPPPRPASPPPPPQYGGPPPLPPPPAGSRGTQQQNNMAIAPAPARGPMPPPRGRGRPPEDDFPDRPRPRRRKKKGSPVLLLSLLGGGLLMVIGLVVLLIILLWGGSGPGGDMAYMPDNADMIASVQVSSLRASGAWKALAKQDDNIEKSFNQLKQEVGVEGDDVLSILVGGKASANQPVMAIRTKKAYSEGQILDNLNWKDQSTSSKEGSYTIHRHNFSNRALCVVNSNLIVFGLQEDLQKIFKRNGQPHLSADLKSAMSNVSFSSTIAVAATLDSPKAKQGLGFLGGMNAASATPKSFAAQANFSSTIHVTANAYFKDGKSAGDMADVIKGGLAAAKNFDKTTQDMRKLLDSISISASGSKIVATANIDPNLLKGGGMDLAMLGKLGGGGFNPPPGGGGFNPPPGGGFNPPPAGGGQNPPPIGSLITKNGPFTEGRNILPNDQFTYQFPVQAGQWTFSVKPQLDAILDIKVYQNGNLVAQDQGLKTNFSLTWTSVAPGTASVQVRSNDNLNNPCAIAFNPGGGTPPFNPPPINPPPFGGGGGKTILTQTSICPKGGFKFHSVQMQAGKVYTIRCTTLQPGYDPYIELMNPNGLLVAQDDDGDGFPNSKLIFNAPVSGNYQLKVRSFANQSGGNYRLTVQEQ